MSKNEKIVEELTFFMEDYIVFLKQLEKSENTLESYSNSIKSFIEFLEQYKRPVTFENMKPTIITNFFDFQSEKINRHHQESIASGTKKLLHTHLSKFFKFVEKESTEHYDFSDIFDSTKVKTAKRTPKGLTPDEEIKIFNLLNDRRDFALNKSKNNKKIFVAYRNLFLIKVLLSSAPRASEVLQIKVSDIKLDPNNDNQYIITIIGKGNKEGKLRIKKQIIEDELNYFKSQGFDKIALTTTKKDFCRKQLYIMVSKTLKDAGVAKSGVHICRHTVAKKVYKETNNIMLVSKILRHENIQTTTIYAEPDEESINESYSNLKSV